MTGTTGTATTAAARPPLPLLVSIALVSAAAIAGEILLMRLFSIIQWHHYAYLIISVALLGYAASGSLIAAIGPPPASVFAHAYRTAALMFAVTVVLSFLAAERVPFNPLEILWDPGQWAWLALISLLLAVPFMCAAACVCLALVRFRRRQALIYGFDLIGAGTGALSTVVMLWVLPPAACLAVASGAAAVAAALAGYGLPVKRRWGFAAAFAGAATVAVAAAFMPVQMSPYKPLPRTLQTMGARVIAERSSPHGLLSVVESERVPFRDAPGMSLKTTAEPPPQLAVFGDGEAMSVVAHYGGEPRTLEYLDYVPSALPYHLLTAPTVLVVGAGGGTDVLKAVSHGARRVDAVEVNPQLVELVRKDFAGYAGGLYEDRRVHVQVAEARGYIAASDRRFDLIEIGLLDAFNTAAAGLHALSESHLYTVEALAEYLRRLTPQGMLMLSRWAQLPPRDDLKLFATAVAALKQTGVEDPGRRLVWIRGWNLSTLLVANVAFSPAQIEAIRQFCGARWFDFAWYPGMRAAEANRYNVWPRAYDYEGATALLGPHPERFEDDYKFNIRPAMDDRPYFFHFFKWRIVPEVLRLGRAGGIALLDQGYFVLIAALSQALLASVVLILLPVWLWHRRRGSVAPARVSRAGVAVYFSAIGLGFMFIEMGFIQKFALFLHHPLYAVAVVLTGFLIFAGAGSLTVSRRQTGQRRAGVGAAVAIVLAVTAVYLLALTPLFAAAARASDAVRIAVALALIAPLAFVMGQPLPLALEELSEVMEHWVPWGFAINGCASVLGAVLATLLMLHLGVNAVITAAAALYLIAWRTFPVCRDPTGHIRDRPGRPAHWNP